MGIKKAKRMIYEEEDRAEKKGRTGDPITFRDLRDILLSILTALEEKDD